MSFPDGSKTTVNLWRKCATEDGRDVAVESSHQEILLDPVFFSSFLGLPRRFLASMRGIQ